MNIRSIFAKNLFRSINGVVKAEQQDEAVVWQELDEYVITKELRQHFESFFKVYLNSVDHPNDPEIANKNGVWISGFFGSGKSHFIKILSYLLENRIAYNELTTESKKAVSFFEDKLEDPIFISDIKRAVSSKTDVVLFNIDTKADHKEGRDAILSVFLRVFNEMQGFSGDYPHIATMESYLSEKGKLERFKHAFKKLDGSNWEEERDAHLFKESQIVEALSQALEISEHNAQNWFDKAEEQQSLTIENFAKQVKFYLKKKGSEHRILFLVDEVGQFIGDDSPLMLNLQTITEILGVTCGGRAWVMVTSQEDIDTILGEFKHNKEQDFSKIQGRFTTRLSLSSSNTDEVIQKRLLSKTADAEKALKTLYAEKADILKNQLSFVNSGASLKNYNDSESFVANYPFVPYHFQLIQKVFESIRKAGATGRHLSRGERSMLDAFQLSAQIVSEQELGTLIPLYRFYPAIEGFLDTTVSRTIKQAAERPLSDFDIDLLRALFLIRYVDILPSNIDNLITLCIEQVDADRLKLRQQIEESLQSLEKETLISRSGDLYYFLTHEEQDVTREIKMLTLESNKELKELSRLIFEEALKGKNKYRYPANKSDYPYARYCDAHPWGRLDAELILEVISPLNDDYNGFTKEQCIARSLQDRGRAIIKMGNPPELGRELRIWLQTDKFISAKSDSSASTTLQRILRDRQEENRERQKRLILLVESLLHEADYYAMGKTLDLNVSHAQAGVDEALKYLLQNIFPKLNYLTNLHLDPVSEIQSILHTSDTVQTEMVAESISDPAQDEISEFIKLKSDHHQQLLLSEVVERFSRNQYGWPEWEIVILVARIAASQSVSLMQGTSPLSLKEAQEYFCKTAKWKLLSLHKLRVLEKIKLDKARKLGQSLFALIGPDGEKELFSFLKTHFQAWKQELGEMKSYSSSGNYPGDNIIIQGLGFLAPLLAIQESYPFIEALLRTQNDLEDLCEDLHDLRDFYKNQKSTWERLIKAHRSFSFNQKDLQKFPEAVSALNRMEEILKAPRPYEMIQETESLIGIVEPLNEALLQAKRNAVEAELDTMMVQIKAKLDEANADATLRNRSLMPIQEVRKQILQQKSIAEIHYAHHSDQEICDDILFELEQKINPEPDVKPPKNIYPSKLTKKLVLETEQDIEEFLALLRRELEMALGNQERIRIK